jgi:hypothetical protein
MKFLSFTDRTDIGERMRADEALVRRFGERRDQSRPRREPPMLVVAPWWNGVCCAGGVLVVRMEFSRGEASGS